mgnify:CR=1 FL=1
MKQSLHLYDLNWNEPLNKNVSRYAPKHKHLSSSQTLLSRIAFTVTVYNMAFLNYWSTVCKLCHFFNDELIKYLAYVEKQDRLKNKDKKMRLKEREFIDST